MTDIPFAIGEEFASKWQFLPYIERGIHQFNRLDVCNVGGLTEAMKVAGWSEAHYVDMMPHNPLGPICTAATVHFSAAVPTSPGSRRRATPTELYYLGFDDAEVFPRLFSEGEYADPETQLHRHVLYHAQEGDMVVVDARGDMSSGVFGDMMSTYFKGRRRRGHRHRRLHARPAQCRKARSAPMAARLDAQLPRADQHLPNAVNVTIACGGVTVIPGDIIVADDDGAVVLPAAPDGLPRRTRGLGHVDHRLGVAQISAAPSQATAPAGTASGTSASSGTQRRVKAPVGS
jgi:hypothetical protein